MADKSIVLRWHEPSIRGYTDVIPRQIVASRSHGETIDHHVLGPRGAFYGSARALIQHGDRRVDLDYARFRKSNEELMDLGVLRFNFAGADRKMISSLEWRDAGSRRFFLAQASVTVPKGLTSPEDLYEGALKEILVSKHERNPEARARCIAHYGARCWVCEFDFSVRYGQRGAGFIHVHHLKRLSSRRGSHKVDPIKDLRPVCPNCHAVLHLKPTLSLESLRRLLSPVGPRQSRRRAHQSQP